MMSPKEMMRGIAEREMGEEAPAAEAAPAVDREEIKAKIIEALDAKSDEELQAFLDELTATEEAPVEDETNPMRGLRI